MNRIQLQLLLDLLLAHHDVMDDIVARLPKAQQTEHLRMAMIESDAAYEAFHRAIKHDL